MISSVREVVEHLLVADPIAAGDDQSPGEFVHAGVGDGVPVMAGGDADRAGQVGFPRRRLVRGVDGG